MSMTKKQLHNALLSCEAIVVKAARSDEITMAIRDPDATTRPRRLSHLIWLAREGTKLVEAGRREKAMRWLGFLQGALWGLELATIEQLRSMNRPESTETSEEPS